MMRILVLGNSHVACLKEAEQEFSSLYPDIELNFFAVSEPFFGKGRTNDAQIYAPHKNAFSRNKIILQHDKPTVDFSKYDHVLAVGLRTPQRMLSDVLENHGILEEAPEGPTETVSRDFLRDLVKLQSGQAVSRWKMILGANFSGTISPAPLPSIAITTTTGHIDRRARSSLILHQHANAEWLFDLWRSELENEMSHVSGKLLSQPKKTIYGPFMAKSDYAKKDNVHMNVRFGLLTLVDFINSIDAD